MNVTTTLLVLTTLIQVTAVIMAIRAMKSNKFPVTWILAILVLAGLALQRTWMLYNHLYEPEISASLHRAILALINSALALAAVWHIRPFLRMLNFSRERIEQLNLFYENSPLCYLSLDEKGLILDVNPVWTETLQYQRDEVLGKFFGDFLTSQSREKFLPDFQVFKDQSFLRQARYEMIKKDKTRITGEFEGTLSRDQLGRIIQAHCAFRDITRQVAAEHQVKEKQKQIRYHLNRQELISEVAICFNNSEELQYKVRRALNLIGHHDGASRVYLCHFRDENHRARLFYGWNNPGCKSLPGDPSNTSPPAFPDWSRWLDQNQLIIAEDTASLPDGIRKKAESRGIQSLLVLPLKIFNRQLGFLAIEHIDKKRSWKDAESKMLETLAHIFTNAFERYEVNEALRRSKDRLMQLSHYQQKMIERDRSHFAHEIHDELGQYLTSIHMGLSWMLRHLPGDKVQLRSKARELISMTNTSLQQTKKLSAEYRPRIIDDMGLIAAVEWYVKEFEKNSRINCLLELCDEPTPHSNDLSISLFRIIQESLTNIYRHAQASQVRVKLEKHKNSLILQVEDDGVGIRQEEKQKSDSYGILGMEERARLIGAELSIKGSKNQGTTITVDVPLKNNHS